MLKLRSATHLCMTSCAMSRLGQLKPLRPWHSLQLLQHPSRERVPSSCCRQAVTRPVSFPSTARVCRLLRVDILALFLCGPVIDRFFSDSKRADRSSDTPSQGGVSSLVYRAPGYHEPAVANGRMWSSYGIYLFQLIDCCSRWTIVSDSDYAMLFPWA